jgi:hypothetical protein
MVIPPTEARPAFFRNVSIDEPSKSKVKLSFCAPTSSLDEKWELGGIKAVAGDPPEFGAGGGFVPSIVSIDLAAGAEMKLDVTVTDMDAQTEPFLALPEYALWNAPSWVSINSQSVSFDPEKKTFHNFVLVNPPSGETGQFAFSIVVTDFQGLSTNRWFYLNITTPGL